KLRAALLTCLADQAQGPAPAQGPSQAPKLGPGTKSEAKYIASHQNKHMNLTHHKAHRQGTETRHTEQVQRNRHKTGPTLSTHLDRKHIHLLKTGKCFTLLPLIIPLRCLSVVCLSACLPLANEAPLK